MIARILAAVVLVAGVTAASPTSAMAAPIYASALVTSSNVTAFGSGIVTGAPDGGGLFLGSTFDPPAQLGSLTVSFATPLGNGVGADLVVLDVVSSTNETFNVEVSTNGVLFTSLGEFNAVANQVDFGAFAGAVNFVRLTNTSRTNSVDVDAVFGNFESTATVPEPTSLLLLGSGIAGLVARRRQRHARSA